MLFQVYSSDKYARHKLLGETDLKLGDIEIRHPLRIWMNLRDMDEVGFRGRPSRRLLLLLNLLPRGRIFTTLGAVHYYCRHFPFVRSVLKGEGGSRPAYYCFKCRPHAKNAHHCGRQRHPVNSYGTNTVLNRITGRGAASLFTLQHTVCGHISDRGGPLIGQTL